MFAYLSSNPTCIRHVPRPSNNLHFNRFWFSEIGSVIAHFLLGGFRTARAVMHHWKWRVIYTCRHNEKQKGWVSLGSTAGQEAIGRFFLLSPPGFEKTSQSSDCASCIFWERLAIAWVVVFCYLKGLQFIYEVIMYLIKREYIQKSTIIFFSGGGRLLEVRSESHYISVVTDCQSFAERRQSALWNQSFFRVSPPSISSLDCTTSRSSHLV